ncbi:hypothetical protein BH23CHL2_BH23CHL2_31960 [soil metagenome]
MAKDEVTSGQEWLTNVAEMGGCLRSRDIAACHANCEDQTRHRVDTRFGAGSERPDEIGALAGLGRTETRSWLDEGAGPRTRRQKRRPADQELR